MMIDKNIDQYYSTIDKNTLTNICKNEKLKNLINLSTRSDIYIFNKKNKRLILKPKDKLIKECNQIKKKELKNSSSMLSNLAKLNDKDTNYVKNICNNLENKITNIDILMEEINNIDSDIDYNIIPTIINIEDKYIECYSNC
jgi:hypothetical protein